MDNSWSFLYVDNAQEKKLRALYSINWSKPIERFFCENIGIVGPSRPYFDFLAFYCNKYNVPLYRNTQQLEDAFLLNVIRELLTKKSDKILWLFSRLGLTYNKGDGFETIRRWHASSDAFKNLLPELLSSILSDLLAQEKIAWLSEFYSDAKILVNLISCRWKVINPFSQQQAIDFCLQLIQEDNSNLSDSEVTTALYCVLLSYFCDYDIHKLNLPQNIARSLKKYQSLFPNYILEKLEPYRDMIIDMLTKRLHAELSEAEIDRYSSVSAVDEEDRILWVDYCFPYTPISPHAYFLRKANTNLADILYLIYRKKDYALLNKISFHSFKTIYCLHDHISYIPADCQKYITFIDKDANPWLKFDELAAELLLLFDKPLGDVKNERNRIEHADNVKALIDCFYQQKRSVQIYEDSMRHLRHDYGTSIGLISDYLECGLGGKQLVVNSFNTIKHAIASVGKEKYNIETVELGNLIHDYVKDLSTRVSYRLVVTPPMNQSMLINTDTEKLCRYVFDNICNNAKIHGFEPLRRKNPVKNIVRFSFEEDRNYYILSIANNGKKLDVDPEHIFDGSGQPSSTVDGFTNMGMRNVYSCIRELNGVIECVSNPDNEFPVIFTIKFPKIK